MFYLYIIGQWNVTPYIRTCVYRRFGGTYCLHNQNRSMSQAFGQQGTGLKIEAILSSEMVFDFYPTSRQHIPEDSTFRSHGCENVKSIKQTIIPSLILLCSWVLKDPTRMSRRVTRDWTQNFLWESRMWPTNLRCSPSQRLNVSIKGI
jgi:hypothetical protein